MSILMESKLDSSKLDSANILQTFWGLSSLDEDEQLGSAKQLITSLIESQESGGDGVCPDLQYSLKRLVRGLASNRKGARQGYFIALTEVLAMFPALPLSQVFDLMASNLEPTGGDKAAEERGMYFGKVFALLALVKSGRLTDKADVIDVAKQLYTCSQRKMYLREFCYVSIGHLVDTCHAQGDDDVIRDHVIPFLALDNGWDGCTPEQLFLLLHLNSIYSKDKWFKDLLVEKIGSKHVLSSSSFEKVGAVLVESTSAHPRLHSVWALVLEAVRGKGHFETFWKTVVDDSLFMSSHERKFLGFKLLETILPSLSPSEVPMTLSPNLLSCLINNSSTEDTYLHLTAKHLLSQLSILIASTNDKDLLIAIYLHLQRITNNKFDRLTHSKVSEEILSKLSVDGIEQLLNNLREIFCDPTTVSSEEGTGLSVDEVADTHSVQLWSLDQIMFLLRHRKLPRNGSWILKSTKNLLLYSLFRIPSSFKNSPPQELAFSFPKVPLSPSVHQALSQRFTSALTDLSNIVLSSKTKKEPSSTGEGSGEDETTQQGGTKRWSGGVPGVMEDGGYFLTALVQYTSQVLNEGSLTLLEEWTDEVLEAWDTVTESVAKLSSKKSLSSEERSFLLLFSAIGLQLLSSKEDRESIVKTVHEVSICYSEMCQSLSKRARTPRKAKVIKEGPGWMAVLTDVLLGFLSQPSQLWRNIVEQVFKQLTHCVNEESLKLILEVLEPKKSKDDLMEVADGEGSESGDSGEDGDSGSGDIGEGGDSGSGDIGEGGDSGSGEDGEDGDIVSGEDSDPGEDGDGVDPVFRADIRKALGAAAMDSEAESEGSIDDDAMMAVDDALAEVFRTRFALKHQKKIKKDEEKSVVHFKLRVLGLVEVFIRKESSNPLVLDLVLPLYEVIQGSQSRKDHSPLVEKAKGIFKTRLCHAKEYPKTDLDVPRIHDYLHQLVDNLNKANALTAPLLTQGFLFLVRVLRGNAAPPLVSPMTTRAGRKRKHTHKELEVDKVKGHGLLNVPEVTIWLSDALHDFITKKNSNVSPLFFSNYIERYPGLASNLVPKLVECLPAAANHFRKTQVYEMLASLRTHIENDEGESPYDQLSSEDLKVMDDMTTKSKKRKRTKHKN